MPPPGLVQAGMPPGMNPGGGVMPASFNPAMAAGGFPPGMAPGMPPASAPPSSMPTAGSQGDIIPAAFNPGGGFPSGGGLRFPVQRTQVRFVRPSGMEVSWYTMGPDGKPSYSNVPIHVPGRYNFLQGAVYRLKLSKIEGRPGVDLYPTLEVVPVNPKTEAFLSHSSVPVEFTAEDFKQIAEGNYVVKVIYLPDPQFQDVAGTGPDEILSTRLEPGADPITEAMRRGSILLVIRMGNMHQELEHTPPINAGAGSGRPPIAIPGVMVPPPGMMPYGPMPGVLVGPGGAFDPGAVSPPPNLPGAPGLSPPPGLNDVRLPTPPSPSDLPPARPSSPPPSGGNVGGVTLPPTPELGSKEPGLPPVHSGENRLPPLEPSNGKASPVVDANPAKPAPPTMLPPASDVAGPPSSLPPTAAPPSPPPSPPATGNVAAPANNGSVPPPPVAGDPGMPNLPPLPDPNQPAVAPAPRPSVAPSSSYLPPTNPRNDAGNAADGSRPLPPTIFDTMRGP
jgi:hypothetical protein